MQAEIITIGDEILVGQTLDTNSNWIAQKLNAIGIPLYQNTTIRDTPPHIRKALDEALSRSEVVLMTGGLGPTKDDVTKQTLAEYFNTELALNEEVLEMIKSYFESKGRELLETNILQAHLPKGCRIIINKLGTASGMWFESKGKIVISMPGVPYEMKAMMREQILPALAKRFNVSTIHHFTVKTQGIGESFLAEKIKDWEDDIRKNGIELAYLPSPGQVRLRLTSYKGNAHVAYIQNKVKEIQKNLPKYVYGTQQETLQGVIGKILLKEKASLSTVESCTGGYLAHLITSVPGSSSYFKGSLLTYSNELKTKLAQVSPETLELHGAVSEETVLEMVTGGSKVMQTDACIATSGIAGPDGGSPEKPVGTIWIAAYYKGQTMSRKLQLGDHRLRNIEVTSLSALNLLRRLILDLRF